MHFYTCSDFHWNNNILYLGKKPVCKVVKYKTGPFYKIYFDDGESQDYYNLSRAKDNAVKAIVREYNEKQAVMNPSGGP